MSRSPRLCPVFIFDPRPCFSPPAPSSSSICTSRPDPLPHHCLPSASLPPISFSSLSLSPPLCPPSPSSAAGPEPGPRRREDGRASGGAGPRPGGWASVGSGSCLPLAGDPAGPAPHCTGGVLLTPFFEARREREDPRDTQAGLRALRRPRRTLEPTRSLLLFSKTPTLSPL